MHSSCVFYDILTHLVQMEHSQILMTFAFPLLVWLPKCWVC